MCLFFQGLVKIPSRQGSNHQLWKSTEKSSCPSKPPHRPRVQKEGAVLSEPVKRPRFVLFFFHSHQFCLMLHGLWSDILSRVRSELISVHFFSSLWFCLINIKKIIHEQLTRPALSFGFSSLHNAVTSAACVSCWVDRAHRTGAGGWQMCHCDKTLHAAERLPPPPPRHVITVYDVQGHKGWSHASTMEEEKKKKKRKESKYIWLCF